MRLGSRRDAERGDTIIEVIFAIVIFVMVAVSSLVIMNKGIATGERALEVTLVRQQINSQAEALRYIHEARVVSPSSELAGRWDTIINDYGQEEASPYGADGGECRIPRDGGYKPFILNARTAQVWSGTIADEYNKEIERALPPYSQVAYSETDPNVVDTVYGLWVEAVPSDPSDETHFVDFHIRACWPGPGSPIPMTLGTIVRLYDPA